MTKTIRRLRTKRIRRLRRLRRLKTKKLFESVYCIGLLAFLSFINLRNLRNLRIFQKTENDIQKEMTLLEHNLKIKPTNSFAESNIHSAASYGKNSVRTAQGQIYTLDKIIRRLRRLRRLKTKKLFESVFCTGLLAFLSFINLRNLRNLRIFQKTENDIQKEMTLLEHNLKIKPTKLNLKAVDGVSSERLFLSPPHMGTAQGQIYTLDKTIRRLKTKKLFESVFCTGLLALFEFYKSVQSA